MNIQLLWLFILSCVFNLNTAFSQDLGSSEISLETTELFREHEVLSVKLSYSHKDIRRNTNDSTYIKTDLYYKSKEGLWDTLKVKLRARGNYRLKNCYFPPVKLKIKKSVAKGTIFEGNKKLKLVLPCLTQKDLNDNVVKEYIAYKLYEIISPYHFKTRMVDIDFTEIRSRKETQHELKGILIEDIDNVADRHNAKTLKRSVHPLQQDNICSVQNDFFQYLIGNTDYSIAYQHNEKLIFVPNKKAMPVPYDFDMSGLVNASYAVVSVVQNQQLDITKVTQRMYRGFKRDEKIYQQVRKEFLDNKIKMVEIVDSFESSFDNPKEFAKTKKFVLDFFTVLVNDSKFNKEILAMARTK